jgi:hypothetical protein
MKNQLEESKKFTNNTLENFGMSFVLVIDIVSIVHFSFGV